MEDLFESEQTVYDHAMNRFSEVEAGAAFDVAEYYNLAKEYGRLLKHLRRTTRLSDRTTTDLFESNLDWQNKALFDQLTGLYNRRYLDENLARNIKSLSRSRNLISVLMSDVDYFKKYNDMYGHSAGDACLKAVGEALLKCVLRAGDFVVRYGGEEFVIILPYTDESGACSVARQVLTQIRSLNIPHEKNLDADHVTISVGITTISPTYTDKGKDYIKRADEAMYLSKQKGRNRYTFLSYQ